MRSSIILLLGSLILTGRAHCQTATESIVYNFPPSSGITSGVIQGMDGGFYGIVSDSIYRVSAAGNYRVVYTFANANPIGITQGPDGNFYGVTSDGGPYTSGDFPNGPGTIFRLTPSGEYTLLYAFGAPGANDGSTPNAPLVLGSDGYFYGTTYNDANGSIFRISLTGVFTPLVSKLDFNDGNGVSGGLLQASDGNFYGVTAGLGLIYRMPLPSPGANPTVTASSFFVFCNTDMCLNQPEGPNGGLIEGPDQQLYGTTIGGGAASYYAAGAGTVYKVSLAGNVTQLYAFCPYYGDGETCDAFEPSYGLALGSDGNFYGIIGPGQYGQGNVFAISPSGNYTDLYDFQGVTDGTPPTQDGSGPVFSLLPTSNGTLAGVTYFGGADDTYGNTYCCGTAYSIALSPALAGPVQIHLSSASVPAGSPVTASFAVSNAFSLTMQQCYGFSTFNGATTALGKVPGALANGLYSGSITFTPTAPGTYNYALTCGGVESGFATLTVTGDNATQTTLQAAPASASVGQPVTLTATVAGSHGDPTGTVNFLFQGAGIGSAPLNGSGVATLAATSNGLPPGSYAITAGYAGSTSYAVSASSPVTVTLAAAPTTTMLAAYPTTVTPPGTVSLQATVRRSASGATGTPTGTVSFYYLADLLGTASLNASGVATFAASSSGIAPGQYAITAKYNGDSSDVTSTSPYSVTVTVK